MKQIQINLNIHCAEEITRLINTVYYIPSENLAFRNYPGLFDLQEINNIELRKNYLTDKYCRCFISTIAMDMNSELSNLFENNSFISVLSDQSTDMARIEIAIGLRTLSNKKFYMSSTHVSKLDILSSILSLSIMWKIFKGSL